MGKKSYECGMCKNMGGFACTFCGNGDQYEPRMNMSFNEYNKVDIKKEMKLLSKALQPKGSVVDIKVEMPKIKNVVFNNPATIVFWEDGTKTVVKVQGKERFNREKGLAMAIAKKSLGNEGNYYEVFKKWLDK